MYVSETEVIGFPQVRQANKGAARDGAIAEVELVSGLALMRGKRENATISAMPFSAVRDWPDPPVIILISSIEVAAR